MPSNVLLIQDYEEFIELAKENVRCWWSVEFNGEEKAVQTIYAEPPTGHGSFVVFRVMRCLTPKILANLEKMYNVKFRGRKFEERVFDACRFLYTMFMRKLRDAGIDARPGKYYFLLKPVSV